MVVTTPPLLNGVVMNVALRFWASSKIDLENLETCKLLGVALPSTCVYQSHLATGSVGRGRVKEA